MNLQKSVISRCYTLLESSFNFQIKSSYFRCFPVEITFVTWSTKNTEAKTSTKGSQYADSLNRTFISSFFQMLKNNEITTSNFKVTRSQPFVLIFLQIISDISKHFWNYVQSSQNFITHWLTWVEQFSLGIELLGSWHDFLQMLSDSVDTDIKWSEMECKNANIFRWLFQIQIKKQFWYYIEKNARHSVTWLAE